MVPVSKVAQPGGNVVVEVSLENGGGGIIEVPDLLEAFQYVGWAWRWSSSAGRERTGFPSSGGMSDAPPGGPPKARLKPGEKCHWFAVLPVLESLEGQKTANLEVILDPRDFEEPPKVDVAGGPGNRPRAIVLKASVAFQVGQPIRLPVRRGLDHRDFAVATATGPSWSALGRVRQKAEHSKDEGVLARWENDIDERWLLAWFCTRLRGVGRSFDLQAWKKLQGAPEEIVLVRNAHVLRAIDFHFFFNEDPDPNVVKSILGDVQGDDSLSAELREKLTRVMKTSAGEALPSR
jgi:hypothetical protein